jgi:hypothetical protein
MKQVSHWRPTNITRYRIKFNRPAPGICVRLVECVLRAMPLLPPYAFVACTETTLAFSENSGGQNIIHEPA